MTLHLQIWRGRAQRVVGQVSHDRGWLWLGQRWCVTSVGSSVDSGEAPSSVLGKSIHWNDRGSRLRLTSGIKPAGDQPQAISEVVETLRSSAHRGPQRVTLEGATGTGKTLVMASIIEELNSPTIVMCPNKVLARQQFQELRGHFKHGSIRLFQSPFMKFGARAISAATGRLVKQEKPIMDEEATGKRMRTLASVCSEDDALVTVASISAIYGCNLGGSRVIIPIEERAAVCHAIKQVLRMQLQYFAAKGDWIRHERLQGIVEEDLALIDAQGWCDKMLDKYLPLCPRESQRSFLDHMNNIYGRSGWTLILDESHQMRRMISAAWPAREARLGNLEAEGYQLPGMAVAEAASSAAVACEAGELPLPASRFEDTLPHKVLYVSATPGLHEQKMVDKVVPMVVRPTGILDPEIDLVHLPKKEAMEDLIVQIATAKGQVLMNGVRHSEIECDLKRIEEALPELKGRIGHMKFTLPNNERSELMDAFQKGRLKVLAGVGLLAEGLSFPTVSLVVIQHADTGGVFRTEEKLTQLAGRATRNPEARVRVYLNSCKEGEELPSRIQSFLDKNRDRRALQEDFNRKNGQQASLPRSAVAAPAPPCGHEEP